MFAIGAVLALIAAWAWLYTRTNAALCSSALVTALSPGRCNEATAIHDLATAGFIVGVVLAIVGVVKLYSIEGR